MSIKASQLHDESTMKLEGQTSNPENLKGNDMTPEGEETPFENPDEDVELMERKHPNPRVNHLICLISLFEFAYGIYMICYSCGNRYSTLIVLGIIGLVFGLSSFYRRAIKDDKYKIFYLLMSFYFFATAIITLCFLIFIGQQAYCDAQWCHKQIDTASYFTYLNNQVGQANLDNECTGLEAKYQGDILKEAIGQYLIDNMGVYCQRIGVCVNATDLYQYIYWHNVELTRGLLIVMGIIQIIYVFWIVYWMFVIRPKELEEYEFMMKHDLAEMPNHPLALKQRELYLQKHERWEKKRLEIEKKNKLNGGPTQRSIWAMEETHTPPNGMSRRKRPGNPAIANPLTVKTKDQVIAPPIPIRNMPVNPNVNNNNSNMFRPLPANSNSPVKPLLKPFNDPTRVNGPPPGNGFGGAPPGNGFGGGPPGFGGGGVGGGGFPQRDPQNFGDQLIRQQQVPINDTQHQMMRSMNQPPGANDFNNNNNNINNNNNLVRRGPPIDFRPKV